MSDFSRYLNQVLNLEDTLRRTPDCHDLNSNLKIPCTNLTDDFCQTLWNDKHRGSINTHDGQLLTGTSPRSKNTAFTLLFGYESGTVNCGKIAGL